MVQSSFGGVIWINLLMISVAAVLACSKSGSTSTLLQYSIMLSSAILSRSLFFCATILSSYCLNASLGVVIERAFAFDPYFAVFEKLLLPNRHVAFEFANGPLAGFECCAAVGRADGDDDAGLTNLKAASAMHDTDVCDVKLFVRLFAQAFHLTNRHRWVGLVNQ